MNTVGRIFIVLIFIMSLVFMSFTVAVYSTSNNWKKMAEENKTASDTAKKEANALKEQLAALQKSVDEQLAAKANIKMALDAEILKLQADKKQTDDTNTALRAAINTATQTIMTTHTSLNEVLANQVSLRESFRKTQNDWNELLSDYVKKTDEAHTLSMKLNNLEEVSKDLVKQYDNAKSVLNQFNLKPIPEMYAGVPPFLITGRITEVRATGLVEITVGEDSGLMKGHQLDVYRKADDGRDIYLGVVEVVLTEPNRAACKILPEYRKGTVQINDVVTSEFSQERQKYQLKRDAHVATTAN